MRGTFQIVALVVVAGLLLAGCGGTPSPAPSAKGDSSAKPAAEQSPYSPLTYKGADRLQKLEAAAKKEGKVTWYTSLAGEIVSKLAEGFKQDYGIEVTVYRAAENNLVTRAVQEDQAGKNMVDVFELTQSGSLDLIDMKLAEPFYLPLAKDLPKELVIPASGDLIWGASDRVSYIGFSYNKKMVPEDAVPNKLEDLANPALKGKLAITSSSTGMRMVGLVLHVMGDAKGKEFLAKLKPQQVRVESISGGALMDLIAQGQVAASAGIFIDHWKQQDDKGVPVGWKALDKAVANVGQVMMGKKAQNPNAAMLFAEYVLAGKGVEILEKNGYQSGTKKQPFEIWVPETGLTSEQYRKSFDTWSELFEKTFS